MIVVGTFSEINPMVISSCRVVTSPGTDPVVMGGPVDRVVCPGTDPVVLGGFVG